MLKWDVGRPVERTVDWSRVSSSPGRQIWSRVGVCQSFLGL